MMPKIFESPANYFHHDFKSSQLQIFPILKLYSLFFLAISYHCLPFFKEPWYTDLCFGYINLFAYCQLLSKILSSLWPLQFA